MKLGANVETVKLAGMALAAASVVWIVMRPKEAGKLAEAIARAPFEVAAGIVAGAVKGAGGLVGLPDPATPEARSACCSAIANGKTMSASANCAAGDFLAWVFSGRRPGHCSGGASGQW